MLKAAGDCALHLLRPRSLSCFQLLAAYSSDSGTSAVILEDGQHHLRDSQVPPNAWRCLLAIRQAGHEVFLVGGAVRDLLLGWQPRDFDLLTTASLQQCQRLLGGKIVGKRHPVCQLNCQGLLVEVSSLLPAPHTSSPQPLSPSPHLTPSPAAALPPWASTTLPAPATTPPPRSPSLAAASHLPWWVACQQQASSHNTDREGGTVATCPPNQDRPDSLMPLPYSVLRRQNALQRDMTVNALLYDPFSQLLFDYVGGWQDLQQRLVRCVGEAGSSFQQDPLRMLRAVRCAARTGFQLEPVTAAALAKHRQQLLLTTNPARLRQDMERLLCHGAAAAAISLLQQHQLLELLLPVHHQYLQRCHQRNTQPSLLAVLKALDGCINPSGLQAAPSHVLLAVLVAPLMHEELLEAAHQLMQKHQEPGMQPLQQQQQQLIKQHSAQARQAPGHSQGGFHMHQQQVLQQPRTGLAPPAERTGAGLQLEGNGALAAAVARGVPLQGLLMQLALTCIEQVVATPACTSDGQLHPQHNVLAQAQPELAAGLLLAAWRLQSTTPAARWAEQHNSQKEAPQQEALQLSGVEPTGSALDAAVATPGFLLPSAAWSGGRLSGVLALNALLPAAAAGAPSMQKLLQHLERQRTSSGSNHGRKARYRLKDARTPAASKALTCRASSDGDESSAGQCTDTELLTHKVLCQAGVDLTLLNQHFAGCA